MALSSTAIFEIRTTGSATNGGGFDDGVSSPGTDYSQQDSAQFSGTDLASSNGTSGTPSVTSAGHSFVSADVGNFIQVSSGTSWTAGIYCITSVSAGAAVLDRACGSASTLSSGTWAEGGALASIANLTALLSDGFNSALSPTGGQIIYLKATANYVLTTAAGFNQSTHFGAAVSIIGYNSTRGDGGPVTITTATNSTHLFDLGFAGDSAFNQIWQNFVFSNTASTRSIGFNANTSGAGNLMFVNCKFTGFTNAILGTSASASTLATLVLDNCLVTSCSATYAVDVDNGCTFLNTRFSSNTNSGLRSSAGNISGVITIRGCIFDSNGANGVGLDASSIFTYANVCGNVFYNNTTAGINHLAGPVLATIRNNIFVSNGVAITAQPLASATGLSGFASGNAFYGNTTVRVNFSYGLASDVTLSGDPLNAPGSNDFTLNNTAGEGALCRAAGFPGALLSGGTGYLDIGALQHQDSGGSSVTYVINKNTTNLIEERA
jgi:hypothetical protein